MPLEDIYFVNESPLSSTSERVVVSGGEVSRNRHPENGKPIRVTPQGIRLQAWQKNPVVFWQHNRNIPIATGTLEMIGGRLEATSLNFHRKTIPVVDNMGMSLGNFDTAIIADLWAEGYVRATSLHVIFSQEDIAIMHETDSEFVIPTSELIEFSIVTIPADRDAIRERMNASGVPASIAQSLCFTYNQQEDLNMSENKAEEQVPERPEQFETEVEIPVVDLVNAIVNDSEAVFAIAQAIANNPSASSILATKMNLTATQPVSIKFISNDKPPAKDPLPQVQQPAMVSTSQSIEAPPKMRKPGLTSIVRSTRMGDK